MRLIILATLLSVYSVRAQDKYFEGFEIGFDGSLNASNFGGVFEIGPKFGFVRHENLVFGPTIRYQRVWSQNVNSTQSFSFNNVGGGFFIHGRYNNVIFGGIEAELLRNRNFIIVESAVFKKFIPTVFICAGFSREFKEMIRINAGIYYDVINSLNSPFRDKYMVKIKDATTGAVVNYVPIIYRISFFFPIGRGKAKEQETEYPAEEEEQF